MGNLTSGPLVRRIMCVGASVAIGAAMCASVLAQDTSASPGNMGSSPLSNPGEAPMKTGALQGVKVPYMKGLAIRMASSHGGDGASRPRKR